MEEEIIENDLNGIIPTAYAVLHPSTTISCEATALHVPCVVAENIYAFDFSNSFSDLAQDDFENITTPTATAIGVDGFTDFSFMHPDEVTFSFLIILI